MTSAAVLLAAASIAAGAPAALAAPARDCSAAETRQLVVDFLSAFNAGRAVRLDRDFARAPIFKWYSTTGPGKRLGAAAYDRSSLLRYFAGRHAQRERLSLRFWSGGGNANGYSHFQFRVVRSARDLPATLYEGKGAIVCSDGGNMIAVWSMGRAS